MTTIATDGRSMAADGLVGCGDAITDTRFSKMRRLKDGRIAGVVGDAYDIGPALDWLDEGGSLPDLSKGTAMLVLARDGSVCSYDYRGHCLPEAPRTALGSGMRFALGALDMGADPARAVAIAVGRDKSSGGTIQVETIS